MYYYISICSLVQFIENMMNLNANQESARTLYSSEGVLTQNQIEPFKTQINQAIL